MLFAVALRGAQDVEIVARLQDDVVGARNLASLHAQVVARRDRDAVAAQRAALRRLLRNLIARFEGAFRQPAAAAGRLVALIQILSVLAVEKRHVVAGGKRQRVVR